MAERRPTYKLILLGDPMVGKTSFVRRHIEGILRSFADEECHAVRYELKFDTIRGPILFEVFDFERSDQETEPTTNFYSNAHCALILFDVTSMESYKNTKKWYTKVSRICGKIPCAIGGNKCDILPRSVLASDVRWIRTKNLHYFDIAALCNYNYVQPFQYLARKLMADVTVELADPRLSPGDVEYDVPRNKQQQYEEAVRKANAIVQVERTVECNVCETEFTVVIVIVKTFCPACEGFYRKNCNKVLRCTKQGTCSVKGINRRSCAACRLAQYRRVLAGGPQDERLPRQQLDIQQLHQQLQDVRHGQFMLQQQLEQLHAGQAQIQQQLNNYFYGGL